MERKTKLQSLFHILLFSFLMIVPLIPIKIKLGLFPISADFVLGGMMILVGIAYMAVSKKPKAVFNELRHDRRMLLLAVLACFVLILSVVSVFHAPNRMASITETLRLLAYLAMFVLIIAVVDERTIERSFKVFYFTMSFACVFGIAQVFFNWSKFLAGGFFGKERIYATFVNPNYWGAALNMVIFYPVICIMERKGNQKFHFAALSLFVANMLFCSTRSAWLGFLAGMTLLCVVRYRKKLIPFAGVMGLLYLVPSVRIRLGENMYLGERFNIWKTGLHMFADNWLAGIGNGGYVYRYREYMRKYPELVQRKPQYSTHNSYIKMLSELGLIGGLAYAALYVLLFSIAVEVLRCCEKYRSHALAFIGFGAAYLLQNLFNNLMFVPQLNVFVWITAALLYKAALLMKRKQQIQGVQN